MTLGKTSDNWKWPLSDVIMVGSQTHNVHFQGTANPHNHYHVSKKWDMIPQCK